MCTYCFRESPYGSCKIQVQPCFSSWQLNCLIHLLWRLLFSMFPTMLYESKPIVYLKAVFFIAILSLDKQAEGRVDEGKVKESTVLSNSGTETIRKVLYVRRPYRQLHHTPQLISWNGVLPHTDRGCPHWLVSRRFAWMDFWGFICRSSCIHDELEIEIAFRWDYKSNTSTTKRGAGTCWAYYGQCCNSEHRLYQP